MIRHLITRKAVMFFLAACLLFSFPVFSNTSDATALTSQGPQRIISMAPNVTEIVFALGAGNRLVGRTDFCDFPPEAAQIPSIGGGMDTGVEAILTMAPDLVIVPKDFFTKTVEKLQELGIPVLLLDTVADIDGVFTSIQTIADALTLTSQGETLVESMRTDMDDLLTQLDGITTEAPRVYYVIGFGDGGDWTAGGDTYIHQMINLAGGQNIAADVSGWSYSLEKLLEEDPDIILLPASWPAETSFRATPGYSELTAVKKGNLISLNNDLIDRQGPRSITGLRLLAESFYPELRTSGE